MRAQVPPPCPHCLDRFDTFGTLDMHLRYTCPVLRGAELAAPTPEPAPLPRPALVLVAR